LAGLEVDVGDGTVFLALAIAAEGLFHGFGDGCM
jgi:hypothetical protein